MGLPYLPSGVNELPARRFVLFSDVQNKVQKQDESVKLADGVSFVGEWVSPSLNRADQDFLWSLTEVSLRYSAEADTTITVEASSNGGENWHRSREVSLVGGNKVSHKTVGLRVTGNDIRIRVLFDTDTLVNLLGYQAALLRRGRARYA